MEKRETRSEQSTVDSAEAAAACGCEELESWFSSRYSDAMEAPARHGVGGSKAQRWRQQAKQDRPSSLPPAEQLRSRVVSSERSNSTPRSKQPSFYHHINRITSSLPSHLNPLPTKTPTVPPSTTKYTSPSTTSLHLLSFVPPGTRRCSRRRTYGIRK